MKNRKTVKVASFITLLLLLANEAVFYLTSMPKEANSLFFMFLGLNTIIALTLYLFSFLMSSSRDTVPVIDLNETNIQDQQALENELQKIDKQKKDAEKKYKDQRAAEINLKATEIMASLRSKDSSLQEYADSLLINLSKHFGIAQGLFFIKGESDVFTLTGSYAFYSEQGIVDFELGEGLAGQVAKNKSPLNISNVPLGYITILSGTGKGQATNLLIFPVIHNNRTIAIVELASFSAIDNLGEEIIVEVSRRVADDLVNFFSVV